MQERGTHHEAKAVFEVDVSDATDSAKESLHVFLLCLVGQPPDVYSTGAHALSKESRPAQQACVCRGPGAGELNFQFATRMRAYAISTLRHFRVRRRP